MKQILVPTDFSECAAKALNFAVQSARYIPMQITLLHAFEAEGTVIPDYMGAGQDYIQARYQEVEKNMLLLKQSIAETEHIQLNTQIYNGQLHAALEKLTEGNAFDLVVMGTKGKTGLKEKIWGTRTASAIRSTDIPILVIPPGYVWKKPEKFLFATSHFEEDPAILNGIFELADLYMAGMQVAVFSDEDDDDVITFMDHTRSLPAFENQLKRKYGAAAIQSAHISGAEFKDSLQQFIREQNIDILVMITYQRNFLERLFHPSQTSSMSYHTHVPLLAVPAKK